ncbi:hypothetical protein [Sphaerimonospora thailandensis]|uniref:Uncharacterized protein n=1 Tax=Sphaerimonospora thailandensis TaxID=795644 RepID=A0A8J3R9Z0_9ACTN|nr:hypothetical protein [Sphaerimonospora thailandensis]GIH70089.1 hypothetical protein Mth01_23420 [Sphaerimonospora thailandensis]
MSLLEDRYRRVLRLLPASYRAEREEEMVSAFLDGAGPAADDDDARPRWPEIASIAALAVRVRLGGAGAAPRSIAWGRAVRLTALLGLAFQATMSCVYLAQALGAYGVFPMPYAHGEMPFGEPGSAERAWHLSRDLAPALWIVGYVALVRGRPRVAKVAAVLGLIAHCADFAVVWAGAHQPPFLTHWVIQSLMLVVPALALLVGFHRDAPAHRHLGRVAVLPLIAGAALFLILMVLSEWATAASRSPQWPDMWAWVWPWLLPSGLSCLALLVASAGYFVAHLSAPRRRSPAVALALAILTVPVALTRLSYLNPGSGDQITETMNAVTVAQVIALLLCGLTLAVIGARSLPAGDTASRSVS